MVIQISGRYSSPTNILSRKIPTSHDLWRNNGYFNEVVEMYSSLEPNASMFVFTSEPHLYCIGCGEGGLHVRDERMWLLDWKGNNTPLDAGVDVCVCVCVCACEHACMCVCVF